MTTCGWCSSHPRAPGARFSSARASRRLLPARPRGFLWSPTSRRRTTSSSATVSGERGVPPGTPGAQLQPFDPDARVERARADHAHLRARSRRSATRTATSWQLQEVTKRLPGRVDPATTTFSSAADLASALRRAAAAHGEHEKRIGEADANWPDWYADYMVRGAGRRGTADMSGHERRLSAVEGCTHVEDRAF